MGMRRGAGRGAAVAFAVALVALLAISAPVALAGKKKQPRDPNRDPFAAGQWALDAIDGRKPLDRFRRRPAEVPVAIVDTGLHLDHPDLQSRLWRTAAQVPGPLPQGGSSSVLYPAQGPVPGNNPGWDTVGTSEGPFAAPDADPEDVGGHGTLVASIAGAATENGKGMAGVAPNARLMALRSCWPQGVNCNDELTAATIRWAVASGARVVNLSWVAHAGHEQVEAAIAAAPQTLFVAAAGNAGDNLNNAGYAFPCEIPRANLICVGASTRAGGFASCSNYGAKAVDVAAPGEDLTVAIASRRTPYATGTPCGTSTAAPHVTGLAALLLGAVPEANAMQVKSAILSGVTQKPALAGRVATGGIIDVRRSLIGLQDGFGIPLPPQTKVGAPILDGRAARFRFRARGAKSRGFECSLDGRPARRCKKVTTFAGLKRGHHEVAVQALGRLNTIDPTPAVRAFKVP